MKIIAGKSIAVIVFLLLLLEGFSIACFAQPGDPGSGVDPDAPVPISGIGWLVMAGAIFGVRRIYNKFKGK